MYGYETSSLEIIARKKVVSNALSVLPVDVARQCSFPVVECLSQSLNRTEPPQVDISEINKETLDWFLQALAFAAQDISAFGESGGPQQAINLMKCCVCVYNEWLSPFFDLNDTARRFLPKPLIADLDHYGHVLIWQMYRVFAQKAIPVASEDSKMNITGWQSFYCKRMIRMLEAIVLANIDLPTGVPPILSEVLHVTIAVMDTLLGEFRKTTCADSFLSNLIPSLTSSVFRIWADFNDKGRMTVADWKAICTLANDWVDNSEVLASWGEVTLDLSKALTSLGSENSSQCQQISTKLSFLYCTWYRFITLFSDPIPAINVETNLILFLKTVEGIAIALDGFYSINSLLNICSHWVIRIALSTRFQNARSFAVRFLLRLLLSQASLDAPTIAFEYLIRFIYLIRSLCQYSNSNLVLSTFLEEGRDLHRLYIIPSICLTGFDFVRLFDSLSPENFDTYRHHCTHILLSCLSYDKSVDAKADKSLEEELYSLCDRLLSTENDSQRFSTILCISRIIGMSTADTVAVNKFSESTLTRVCDAVLTKWLNNYIVALNCIQYMTIHACFAHPDKSSILCIKTLCSFIKIQLCKEARKHLRQMHTAIVLAFECLGILLLSFNLESIEDVMDCLTEVIVAGLMGHLSNSTNDEHPIRPASGRVQHAAYRLLDWLVHCNKPLSSCATSLSNTTFAVGDNHILELLLNDDASHQFQMHTHTSTGSRSFNVQLVTSSRSLSNCRSDAVPSQPDERVSPNRKTRSVVPFCAMEGDITIPHFDKDLKTLSIVEQQINSKQNTESFVIK